MAAAHGRSPGGRVRGRGSSSWAFLAATSDPERALRQLLERDRMFTDRLREEAELLGVGTVEADETMTEDELAAAVATIVAR